MLATGIRRRFGSPGVMPSPSVVPAPGRLPATTSWPDGSPISYSKWAGGKAPPSAGNDTCVAVALLDHNATNPNGNTALLNRGDWSGLSCQSLLPPVCEAPIGSAVQGVSDSDDEDGSGLKLSYDPSMVPYSRADYGSSSYYLFDGVRLGWADAQAFCAQRFAGGRLVSVSSLEEEGAVLALLDKLSYWVGLDDRSVEGAVQWADGVGSRPLPWKLEGAQPLTGQSDTNDCVAAGYGNGTAGARRDPLFVARGCEDLLPYACSVKGAALSAMGYPFVVRWQGGRTPYEYLFFRNKQANAELAEKVCIAVTSAQRCAAVAFTSLRVPPT